MPIVNPRMRLVDKVFILNQINPNGFRKPGRNSYSLLERLLQRDGTIKPETLPRERESRGKRYDLSLRREKRRALRQIAMERHKAEASERERIINERYLERNHGPF